MNYLLRLWGSGRLRQETRRVIEAEHCRWLSEGVVGIVTGQNDRSSRRRASSGGKRFLGALAITDKRLVVYRYSSCLLNVLLTDPRLADIDFSAETAGWLTISHDASLFDPTSTGEIEISLRIPDAMHVCGAIATSRHKIRSRSSNRAPAR